MTMRGGGGVSLEPATWRADPRYDTFMAYSRSKLANLLTSYELARRLRAARQQTTINALHPGLIRSRLGREMSPLLTLPFLLLFGASPERGARAILNLAVAPNLQGRSGLYFDELRETASSPYSYDQHQQARAWAESVAATGLDFSPAPSPHR
jgi:NAD(P)-dependent dehydrogenase (short-subunit alcohol dehydrogenase family)